MDDKKTNVKTAENGKQENAKGISLRKLNYIMSAITLVISIVLLVSTYLTSKSYKEVRDNTGNYISWERTAEELQNGSDYLTEQVRAFAVTAKKEYLENYFIEANVTRRRDHALEVLKEKLETTEAYANLYYAMQKSLELMEREYYSMRLTVEANGYSLSSVPSQVRDVKLSENDAALSNEQKAKLAEEMVFDDIYHRYKEDISRETNKCISNLAKNTNNQMSLSFESLQGLLILQQSFIIGLVIVILIVIALTSVQVIGPLVRAIPHIKKEQPLPINGAYEYRFLANTYNNMYEVNKQNKELLAFEAAHDVLTGVYNRGGFEKKCATDGIKNAAILLIDIDNFKTINDTFGHEKGDKALIAVSSQLQKHFAAKDIICRFGGDEFMVLVKDVSESEEFKASISKRIVEINDILSKPERDHPACSISAGIAFYSDGDDFDNMKNKADAALYEVKNNGKHGYAFFK